VWTVVGRKKPGRVVEGAGCQPGKGKGAGSGKGGKAEGVGSGKDGGKAPMSRGSSKEASKKQRIWKQMNHYVIAIMGAIENSRKKCRKWKKTNHNGIIGLPGILNRPKTEVWQYFALHWSHILHYNVQDHYLSVLQYYGRVARRKNWFCSWLYAFSFSYSEPGLLYCLMLCLGDHHSTVVPLSLFQVQWHLLCAIIGKKVTGLL